MTELQDTQENVVLEVRLSRTELIFLLRALGLPGLPGFEMPEEFPETAAQIALDVLRARQFAALDRDGSLQIDEQLAALIGAGSAATRAMAITVDAGGTDITDWIYLVPEFTVLHEEPEPDVHHFRTLLTGIEMLAAISELLGMSLEDETQPQGKAVRIPRELYDRAQSLLRDGDAPGAMMALTDGGIPSEVAQALITFDRRAVVSIVESSDGEDIQGDGFMTLSDSQGRWLVRADNGAMSVDLSGEQAVLDAILGLLGVPA